MLVVLIYVNVYKLSVVSFRISFHVTSLQPIIFGRLAKGVGDKGSDSEVELEPCFFSCG